MSYACDLNNDGLYDDGVGATDTSNSSIPSSYNPAYLIAGYFERLDLGTGTIHVQKFGDRVVSNIQM